MSSASEKGQGNPPALSGPKFSKSALGRMRSQRRTCTPFDWGAGKPSACPHPATTRNLRSGEPGFPTGGWAITSALTSTSALALSTVAEGHIGEPRPSRLGNLVYIAMANELGTGIAPFGGTHWIYLLCHDLCFLSKGSFDLSHDLHLVSVWSFDQI